MTSDFGTGSVDETASVPGAAMPGCAPSSPEGLLQSAHIRVTDGSGYNWTNVVTSFDTIAGAHAFATAFFSAVQHCATGSGAGTDTVGNDSFRYVQHGPGGGFGNATVEVVQVVNLITIVIDGPNIGPYPPSSELGLLVRASVTKLTNATG